MPHYVCWLVEGHIVYNRVWGDFTEDELTESDAEIIPLLEQGTTPLVHVLSDDVDLESMPGMKKMSELKYVKHDRMGWFVTSNQNRLMRFIGSVVGQLLKTRHRFVDSPEDGLDFLLSVDDSLPDKATLIQHFNDARAEAKAHAEHAL